MCETMSIRFDLLLLLLFIPLSDGKCDDLARGDECLPPLRKCKEKCSIYMAPSSVRGINGMGLFTTDDMTRGDELLSDYDGPSIPVLDFKPFWLPVDELATARLNWTRMFDDYWWGRGLPDHTLYEAKKVIDFQITFGALPNHHCALSVIDHKYNSPSYDDSLLPSDSSPSVGAISYHNGRNFFVKRNVTAGSELFLNYGHCNREKKHPQWAQNIPMRQDFTAAASATALIWDILQGDFSDEEKIDTVISRINHGIKNPVLRNLIPNSSSQFLEVIQGLNRWNSKELVRRIATLVSTRPRSPEWIRENGLCIENLIPGRSGIRDAGRGAFAQFALRKGDIIVPVPLLQIVNRDVLIMTNKDGQTIGSQLLLNYCFGHSQSSLLLCPITNAILMNHCSSRRRDPACKDGPNAKIQWASDWDKTYPRWTDLTIDELTLKTHRGLSMEIVALRDIEVGEEVFIDYGQDWELAWEKHIEDWIPPNRGPSYLSATKANANPEQTLQLFLSYDLRKEVHHQNLYTACSFDDDFMYYSSPDPSMDANWWHKLDDDELLMTYSSDGSINVRDYQSHEEDSHWKCQVIKPDGDKSYTVRIVMNSKNAPIFLTKYPLDSIRFFHKKYFSDQHLTKAFRHHIGIPEQLMPVNWKNRVQESHSTRNFSSPTIDFFYGEPLNSKA